MADETTAARTRDPLIEYLEHQERRHRERLIDQARGLADHLTRLADRLERNPERAVISELGEVQSAGSMIDVRCAAYVTTREDLRAARGFAGGAS